MRGSLGFRTALVTGLLLSLAGCATNRPRLARTIDYATGHATGHATDRAVVATAPTPAATDAPSTEAALPDQRLAPVTPEEIFRHFDWPDDPRLRSAGLLRSLDRLDQGGVDPRLARQSLRDHFGAVVDWLASREEIALATATQRLEAAQQRSFSIDEREAVKAELRAARDHQLETLAAYAERGIFPLNPDAGARTAPIFVDAVGTACAVGQLMLVDGWGEAVEGIRISNNGVFVPDVASGPILAWVATSGLLLEEAAVIQPGYPPPPGNVDLTALAEPGASHLGLIDHFSATRSIRSGGVSDSQAESLKALFPDMTLDEIFDLLGYPRYTLTQTTLDPATLSDILLHVSNSAYSNNGPSISSVFAPSQPNQNPSLSPWLFWNGSAAGGFLDVPAGNRRDQQLEIAFDLHASPGQAIDAVGLDLSPFDGFWGAAGSFGVDLLVEMEVRGQQGDLLADISLRPPPVGLFPSSAAIRTFAPQSDVSVVVRGTVARGNTTRAYWGQFKQDFRIVAIPEPNLLLLLGLGIAGLAAAGASSNRST